MATGLSTCWPPRAITTHEEMFTFWSRTCTPLTRTYPSLYGPGNAATSSVRASLIRGREFVMKDAYSFTIDEEGMRKAYYDERGATSVSSSVLT